MKSRFSISRTVVFLLALGMVFTISRCAVRRPPSGGPPDKTPPQVVSMFPTPDSTNVKQLAFLEIRFDETVDRTSLRNQVWMLPEPPGGFTLKWKGGKILRIMLNDSLESNQTYLLTVGTGVKDIRGNELKAPIVLPFSTGPHLDKGEISGEVIGKNIKNVFVFAYRFTDSLPDSAIFRNKPRYSTQVNEKGAYYLRYLSPGRYRIFALDDQDHNRLYTLQTDRIGIPFQDITLDSMKHAYADFNLVLTREDTTAPVFYRATAEHQHLIKLTFNEPVLPATDSFAVSFMDSTNGSSLPVRYSEVDSKEPSRLLIFTANQTETTYSGRLRGISDTTGNMLHGTVEFSVTGSAEPDTTSPRLITFSPGDNEKNIDYQSAISVTFNQPVDSSGLIESFALFKQDSTPVNGRWRFSSLRHPIFVPDTLLEKGTGYFFKLDLSGVKDIYGRGFGDSLHVHHFSTWDWADLGEITGTVRTNNPDWKRMIVTATPFTDKQKHYTVRGEIGKTYQISFLPGGLYKVNALVDVNENGELDGGSTVPFRFAEPYLIFPDTVKVRKRWTTEGIDFHFNW